MQETTLNPFHGREVKAMINKLRNKRFQCMCGHTITIKEFKGYPHHGGHCDKYGNKWWVCTYCPVCGYAWAARKLMKMLEE